MFVKTNVNKLKFKQVSIFNNNSLLFEIKFKQKYKKKDKMQFMIDAKTVILFK